MTKIISLVIGVLIVGALGSWLLLRDRGAEILPQQELRRAPEFALKDYNGQEIKLSDFRGKAVVVNSWAVWCPFCKEELKDFAAIRKEFGDKAAIIAVDRAEPRDTAKKFSDELGVSDDLIFLLDPDDTFYQSIGGFSMPETVFVDRDGLIRFHKRGSMPAEEIRRRIEDLLGT